MRSSPSASRRASPTTPSATRSELLRDAPGGVKVTVTFSEGPSGAWLYTPQGPAFDAADRAYTKAWGRSLLQVGIGGAIPFVALFGRRGEGAVSGSGHQIRALRRDRQRGGRRGGSGAGMRGKGVHFSYPSVDA